MHSLGTPGRAPRRSALPQQRAWENPDQQRRKLRPPCLLHGTEITASTRLLGARGGPLGTWSSTCGAGSSWVQAATRRQWQLMGREHFCRSSTKPSGANPVAERRWHPLHPAAVEQPPSPGLSAGHSLHTGEALWARNPTLVSVTTRSVDAQTSGSGEEKLPVKHAARARGEGM